MNYKFGSKNNWRRTIWNRISERVEGKNKDAIVLYMPDFPDYDKPVALSKGFCHHNMIAVNRDVNVVNAVRENIGLAVNAKASEIVKAWPASRKCNVIFFDFMNGHTKEHQQTMFDISTNPAFEDAVVAFNVMRGRDGETNFVRSMFQAVGKISPECVPGEKHRGEHMFVVHAVALLSTLHNILKDFKNQSRAPDQVFDSAMESFKAYYTEKQSVCTALSYKSISGQVFDSIIYKNISLTRWLRSSFFGFDIQKTPWEITGTPLDRIRKSITATMAVRTSRLN